MCAVKRVFAAPAGTLVLIAALLAPLVVGSTILLAGGLDWIFELESIPPNSVGETAASGLGATRVLSALVIAPIIENLLCVMWTRWLPPIGSHRDWWLKPLLVGAIAATFHAIIFMDIRPAAVFPGFFVIGMFIRNTRNATLGYWISVLHHFFINLINILAVTLLTV